MTRKRPVVIEGLIAGVKRVDIPAMGAGVGDGLVRVSEAWLPKQKLAVPQECPILHCPSGPYSSLLSLRRHLKMAHSGMSDRERSFALDGVRREAVRQAMNGTGAK